MVIMASGIARGRVRTTASTATTATTTESRKMAAILQLIQFGFALNLVWFPPTSLVRFRPSSCYVTLFTLRFSCDDQA